jgi:hypothetical protein
VQRPAVGQLGAGELVERAQHIGDPGGEGFPLARRVRGRQRRPKDCSTARFPKAVPAAPRTRSRARRRSRKV